MLISYCCFVCTFQANKVLNGRIQVCFVVTLVCYEIGQFFSSVCFSTFFQVTKHLFKKEAMLLKLLEVTIHVCVVLTSTFIEFAAKDSVW